MKLRLLSSEVFQKSVKLSPVFTTPFVRRYAQSALPLLLAAQVPDTDAISLVLPNFGREPKLRQSIDVQVWFNTFVNAKRGQII